MNNKEVIILTRTDDERIVLHDKDDHFKGIIIMRRVVEKEGLAVHAG